MLPFCGKPNEAQSLMPLTYNVSVFRLGVFRWHFPRSANNKNETRVFEGVLTLFWV